jgi:hypothetical protein
MARRPLWLLARPDRLLCRVARDLRTRVGGPYMKWTSRYTCARITLKMTRAHNASSKIVSTASIASDSATLPKRGRCIADTSSVAARHAAGPHLCPCTPGSRRSPDARGCDRAPAAATSVHGPRFRTATGSVSKASEPSAEEMEALVLIGSPDLVAHRQAIFRGVISAISSSMSVVSMSNVA